MASDAPIEAMLKRLASDRRSGAAELLWLGWAALWSFAIQRPHDTSIARWKARLAALAERIPEAQPAMAPLLRLTGDALLATAEARSVTAGRRALRAHLRSVARARRAAPRRVAAALAGELGEARRVLTHSSSSTVLAGLLRRARRRHLEVICCEARPGREGARMARELARAGASVTLICDAAAALFVPTADAVVVGADAVGPAGILNKTGTLALGLAARHFAKPMWAAADTLKLVPAPLAVRLRLRPGPAGEVLGRRPTGLRVANPYFEWTPLELFRGVVTEEGPVSTQAVRRRLRALQVGTLAPAPGPSG